MKISNLRFSASRGIGLACIAAAAFLAAGGAQAQAQAKASDTPFYGEIGYTALTYEELGSEMRPKAVRLLGAYELNPNLAVEAHLLLGAKDGSTTFLGDTYKVKIDNIWGVFLKPKVAVMPGLDLFARVGFARTSITGSGPGFSNKDSDNSVAYGVGAAYAINEKVTVSLDYMSYYDREDTRIQGPTLGLGIRF